MQKNHKKDYQKKDYQKKPFKKKHFGRHDFYVEGNPEAVKVPDSSAYSLERAMKYLKRQLKDTEKITKYRDKREYIKPSEKRRIQKEEAVRTEQYRDKMSKRYGKGYVWVGIFDGKAM